MKDILDVLPGGPNLWDAVYYESYGGYVDDPDATIFYRKDLFRLIENGFYWWVLQNSTLFQDLTHVAG